MDLNEFFFKKRVSWIEKGSKYKNFRFKKINNLPLDDLAKGVSWTEKGSKPIRKKLKIYCRFCGEVLLIT